MLVRFIFFLTSATLICRGTDISKCFRESLGIRDNESTVFLSWSRNIKESCSADELLVFTELVLTRLVSTSVKLIASSHINVVLIRKCRIGGFTLTETLDGNLAYVNGHHL